MEKQNRTLIFGSRSLITALLVVSIVGVVNFLGARNQFRIDLTKNQIHSLSDQTRKILTELKSPVKAVYFAKLASKEQVRPFLESYRSVNPAQFSLEYVDPDKQPARAKQAGVTKYGTLQLITEKVESKASQEIGAREVKVEELTEEKVTHALIKLLKGTTQQVCFLSGHGEKGLQSDGADGNAAIQSSLKGQSYEVKELNLVSAGKIPADCSLIAIWGPTSAFFPQEINLLSEYLKRGGRLLVGLDMSFDGKDPAKELNTLLAPWGLQYSRALLIDPSIRAMQLDASVLIVNQFSREHPVTRDLTTGAALPLSRPISKLPSESLKIETLLTTSSQAWAESNLKEITSGAVQYTPSQDTLGAQTPGLIVEGKAPGSSAPNATRIVAFGSSSFANNTYSRMLNNMDLFLNAMAWALEDESTIAIRPKQSEEGRLELTGRQGIFVFLLTVVAMPILVAAGGIGFWAYRRKL